LIAHYFVPKTGDPLSEMMRRFGADKRASRAALYSSARESRYPRHDQANANTGTLPGKTMRAASRVSRRRIGQPGTSSP